MYLSLYIYIYTYYIYIYIYVAVYNYVGINNFYQTYLQLGAYAVCFYSRTKFFSSSSSLLKRGASGEKPGGGRGGDKEKKWIGLSQRATETWKKEKEVALVERKTADRTTILSKVVYVPVSLSLDGNKFGESVETQNNHILISVSNANDTRHVSLLLTNCTKTTYFIVCTLSCYFFIIKVYIDILQLIIKNLYKWPCLGKGLFTKELSTMSFVIHVRV